MTPFSLYHAGKIVSVLTDLDISPIIKLCTTSTDIYLLSNTHKLYKGNYVQNPTTLSVELYKSEIVDVELWADKFYIVDENGYVYLKDVQDSNWTKVSFENESNVDIRVRKIKCNSVGSIYVTQDNIIYGNGNSGQVLQSENPVKLKCFEGRKIIDVSAGEDFFIILSSGEDLDDEDENLNSFLQMEVSETSLEDKRKLNFQVTPKEDSINEIDPVETTSSIESLKSNSSDSSDTTENNIKHIIKLGANLIKTSVCSFGTSNDGVLGTGDHIKRPGLNGVLDLTGIGVCSVSSGRHHSLARTIDGRVFYWGLNTFQQIDERAEITDLSAPKEIQLPSVSNESCSEEHVLDAFCYNYGSVVISANMNIGNTGDNYFNKELVLHSSPEKSFPLIVVAKDFVLQNHKSFARNYEEFLTSMQTTVRKCIKHRFYVTFVRHLQKSWSQFDLGFSNKLCQGYLHMLNILAVCLKSVEEFYCEDITIDQLLFIVNSKEVIKAFDEYSQAYCDVKSVRGFSDIAHNVQLFQVGENENCERVFSLPFEQITNISKFIERLMKDNFDAAYLLKEKLFDWQRLVTRHGVNIELAEHTNDFWSKNSKNNQLKLFRKTHRRVILDSSTVPLKLAHGGTFSTHSFILFSDCFCQYGSILQVFPLNVLWVYIDGENCLKIISPEKTFILNTRNHSHKLLWCDQIESAIKTALEKPIEEKLSSFRLTGYTFSAKHPKYGGVRCYGRWKLGVMHGVCYLEYPDGRIYYGDMENGEMTGYGKMILPFAGLYEGYFKNGKFHGHGTYEMKDNQTYDGHFQNGAFHGHGVLKSNEFTYAGDFSMGWRSGYGVLDETISGNKYLGMFTENRKNGAGAYVTSNGDYFESVFVNDELCGEGIAAFENGCYYEGELTITGPSGKGCYYLPSRAITEEDTTDKPVYMIGNIISGNLGGTWKDIKVLTGSVSLNQKFPKHSRSIGEFVVHPNVKWRALFEDWTDQIFHSQALTNVKALWNNIAIFISNQKAKERYKEEDFNHPVSYFAKNLALQANFADLSLKFSSSLDKISLKSTSSLYSKSNQPPFEVHKKYYSDETLFDLPEKLGKIDEGFFTSHNPLSSFLNGKFFKDASETSSQCSSAGSSTRSSSNTQNLDFIPNYGITFSSEDDLNAIKQYLSQAFKDPFHPLGVLFERVCKSFYISYGCWQMKPTSIISSQAMLEWESISQRMYTMVKKMFPVLSLKSSTLDSSREAVSHVNILYPIVLSEGIYSTLFVLYANKHNEKDELYRQKLLLAGKKTDFELANLLNLKDSLTTVVQQDTFKEAAKTLKEITEKYYPQGMLDVIEKTMQQLGDAYKDSAENNMVLGAEDMMPLAIFLTFRAEVPHLGAELALLEDLMGKTEQEGRMLGFSGYCFTTLKAAYEHIINCNLDPC